MQVCDALIQLTQSNMSTSDSDYSIDWLASDEDERDGGHDTLRPQFTEETVQPSSSSSSSSSSSEAAASSPTAQRRRRRKRRRRRSKDGGGSDSVQGFTSISVEAELRSNRKWTHKDEGCRAEKENELFSHKCAELQCYIQPLSSILQGLRSGRYSERLNSFQESVAMDRIQRIMGVLQNPGVGGHFLSIILKIEEMLQSWFPHIKTNTQKKLKRRHGSAPPPPPLPPPLPPPPPPSASSTSPPVFYHNVPEASPCCRRPDATCSSSSSFSSSSSSSSSCRGVTQDNAVSSSTDSKTLPPRRHKGAPLPLKISSPCLERLLQAKDSVIIITRTDGGGGAWW